MLTTKGSYAKYVCVCIDVRKNRKLCYLFSNSSKAWSARDVRGSTNPQYT